ncbi:MAG: hypothetical protein ACR2JC_19800, partial [Chloroflexota bacterium]
VTALLRVHLFTWKRASAAKPGGSEAPFPRARGEGSGMGESLRGRAHPYGMKGATTDDCV